MKWHFRNKTIIGKLVMFLSAMFGVVLFSMSNLTGIKTDKYGVDNTIALCHGQAEKFFIENYFLGEIKKAYNYMFAGFCIIGIAIILIGWKRYCDRYKDGLCLYNIGTALLSATLVGYGLTALLLLKIFSWEVVPAIVIGVLLLALLIKNLIHYRKHKRILQEEVKNKRVIITGIIALVSSVVVVAAFVSAYSYIKGETVEEYRERYVDTRSDLLYEEGEHSGYILVNYINYFNPEGREFDYDTLKQEIESFTDETKDFSLNGWDNLWYCLEYLHFPKESYGTANQFSSLGYGEKGAPYAFVIHVENKLNVDGIAPEEATREQLDEACQYIYDIYASQTPLVHLGDDEGELVVNIDIPESGNVEDIKISWEGEGYCVYTHDWYLVEAVGDDPYHANDREAATTLKDGQLYFLRVRMKLALPYYASEEQEEPLVRIEGVKCEDMKTSVFQYDTVTADIWVIPGQDN